MALSVSVPDVLQLQGSVFIVIAYTSCRQPFVRRSSAFNVSPSDNCSPELTDKSSRDAHMCVAVCTAIMLPFWMTLQYSFVCVWSSVKYYKWSTPFGFPYMPFPAFTIYNPAVWCRLFQSRVFRPCTFDGQRCGYYPHLGLGLCSDCELGKRSRKTHFANESNTTYRQFGWSAGTREAQSEVGNQYRSSQSSECIMGLCFV